MKKHYNSFTALGLDVRGGRSLGDVQFVTDV